MAHGFGSGGSPSSSSKETQTMHRGTRSRSGGSLETMQWRLSLWFWPTPQHHNPSSKRKENYFPGQNFRFLNSIIICDFIFTKLCTIHTLIEAVQLERQGLQLVPRLFWHSLFHLRLLNCYLSGSFHLSSPPVSVLVFVLLKAKKLSRLKIYWN